MKKISFTLLAVIIIGLLICACNNNTSTDISFINSDFNQSKASDDITLKFIKLPSPPKYKYIKDEEIINRIYDYIENYNKTEITVADDVKGWSILLNFSNGFQISYISGQVKIDDKFFKVDENFESGLLEIYYDIDTEELDY